MSKYIDLVVCKHDNSDTPYLFYAPEWSSLKEGDRVLVEIKRGVKEATVVFSGTVELNSDEYKLALSASNAKELKKVLKKIVYKEFDYKEETEDE